MDKETKRKLTEIQEVLPIVFRFMTVEKLTEVADIANDEQFSRSTSINTGFIIRTSPSRPIFNEHEEVSHTN